MSALRAALVTLLATGPAAAQVTPEQVWVIWQAIGEGAGYRITATDQRREGAALVLDGVAVSATAPLATLRAPLGQVVMRDLGNGTVEITIPPSFDMAMTSQRPDRDPVDLSVSVQQDGYVAVASGTPEAPRFAVSANALTFGLKAPAAGDAEVVVSLNGLRGSAELVPGAAPEVSYDLAVDAMTLSAATASPTGGGRADLRVTARAMTAWFHGTLPVGVYPGMPPAEMMAAGLRGSGGYKAGMIDFGLDMPGVGGVTTITGSAGGGSVDFGLDDGGLTYRTGLTGLNISASGGMVPLPSLDLAIDDYALDLTMPLARTEIPADFSVLLRLDGLSVPEATWAMIDPGGILPRDPGSVALDVKGKATVFDPAATDQPPGQVDSVTLDRLAVSVAGATLAATGAVALDNADHETFPGMPRPAGSVDVTLTGGNALLDRLSALGIVPPGQLIAARMGLLMVMLPGAGPDTMTSRLEITPDAQVLANGQRLR